MILGSNQLATPMQHSTIRDMVDAYCADSSSLGAAERVGGQVAIRPVAMKLDRTAEENLINICFPQFVGSPRQNCRKSIEEYFAKNKPSGIEIIVWNQTESEVFFAVPVHK